MLFTKIVSPYHDLSLSVPKRLTHAIPSVQGSKTLRTGAEDCNN